MAADLTPLLEARSVAVVGASADPLKIGGRPISYLKRLGYDGRIVAVNPARKEVQGVACLPSILEAGEIDLAVIAAPAPGAADAVAQSLQAGVRSLVLFTAGYAEVDAAGAAAQAGLAARAREAGAVLLGPNCLGAINVHARLAASFTTALETLDPVAGGFSYMGQSGALGAYWLEMASRAGLGVGNWITTGNEAMATGADALAYLARDAVTRVIAAYIEDIKDPDAFASAAEAACTAGKTLLTLKSGRSPAGARAARAHTASTAGEAGWYDGFLRECGAVPARSLSEMIDVARVLTAAAPPPPDPRLAVVTVSGGAGVLACDAAEELGLRLAEVPAGLAVDLRAILPGFAHPQNPVDVTGAVVSDKDLMRRTLHALAASDACDAIVLFLGSMGSIADNLVEAIEATLPLGKPMVTIWMAAPAKAAARIQTLGVPVFDEIRPALAALALGSLRHPGGRPDRGQAARSKMAARP